MQETTRSTGSNGGRGSHVVMLVSNGFKPDPGPFKVGRSLVKAGYWCTVLAWDTDGTLPRREEMAGMQAERFRDAVTLAGFVPYGEVPRWYRRLDATVITYDLSGPARYAALGSQQKVFEAMACGVPVVLRGNEYMNRMVARIGYGVAPGGSDVDPPFAAVETLAGDPDLRYRMAEAEHRAFRDCYHWESEERHLWEVYDRAIGGRKS